MTELEAIRFVKSTRSERKSRLSLLREENTELLKVIADYDQRLAQVEAERDELKFRLDLCNAIAKRIGAGNLMRHRQRMTI